jgi:hypothetical protein
MNQADGNNEPFQYEPLLSPRTIRLLRFERGTENRLSCTLLTRALESVPGFQALSYVWGEWTEANLRWLYIDGKRLQITSNLYSALIQLQHSSSTTIPEFYWADQICIDQSNARERSNQVAFMDQIFSHAAGVIVWLGRETKLMIAAFEGLRVLAAHIVENGGWEHFFQHHPTIKMQYFHQFCRLQDPCWDEDAVVWQALAEFTRNEWFFRLWVFQELILAKKAVFVCGSYILDSHSVLSCFNAILQSNHRLFVLMHGQPTTDVIVQRHYNALVELSMMRAKRARSKGQSLCKLIAFAAYRDAKDPRDKIYALRGLAADITSNDLLPDYTLETGEVYKSLAHHYLKEQKFLEVFSLIYPPDEPLPGISVTPSWVPKLSRKVRRPPMIYDAAGSTTLSITFLDQNTISIEGKIVDTITDIGAGTRREGSYGIDEILTVMRECDRIAAKQMVPYPTQEDRIDVLWRTLIQDADHDEHTASPSLRDTYLAWRRYLDQAQHEKDLITSHDVSAFSRHVASNGLFYDHTLCVTAGGYLALISLGLSPGDQICVLSGGHMPFAIRACGAENYLLLAQVYVHGLMEGEAMKMEEVPFVKITLV